MHPARHRESALHSSLAGLLIAGLSLPALAGTVVKQNLASTLDGTESPSTQVWTIDGNKFHLAVKGKHGETTYLFNGRNFYVCSRLDAGQLDFLKKNELGQPELLAKFKNGACQAVPNNFMVRFFLSPIAALESINQSDSMQLTLEISEYDFKASTKKNTIRATNCGETSRNFAIVKTGEGEDHKQFTTKTAEKETLCTAPTIDWRAGLWMEVNKTVMRQPKSAALLQKLRADYAQTKGLPLSYQSELSLTDSKGTHHSGHRTLTTESISTEDISPKTFLLPTGFNLLSPESLNVAQAAPSKVEGTKKQENAIDTMTSVFFCAIAGALGCFSF